MKRVVFTLSEIKESPNGKSKLNIEMNFEPAGIMREDSHLKRMAEAIINAIDDQREAEGGEAKLSTGNKK